MQTISATRFAALDFESAGARRGETDVPVQVGIALWSPRDGLGETFCSFLSAGRPVTWAARKVHGITPSDLAGAPSLVSLWPELRRLLAGRALVAHGHGTEKRFLRAFPGHPFGPWIDTLHLFRAAWPDRDDYSLGALCDGFGISPRLSGLLPDRRWHDALYDASASALLLADLVGRLGLFEEPLDFLLQPDISAWRRRRLL